MTTPGRPKCPDCGEFLEAIDGAADTPPWWSPGCSRLWWDAEITLKARKKWRKNLRDFGEDEESREIAEEFRAESRARIDRKRRDR